MDMIILAAIAAFIVYRLYITLGEKTGYQGDESTPNNVVDISKKTVISPKKSTVASDDFRDVPKEFVSAIKDIKALDTSFSYKEFIENATYAFEIILESYAKADRDTLKNLVAPAVYSSFDQALEDLESKDHELDITLVRVENVDVLDVRVHAKIARIQIRFITEQVPLVKDKSGDVIDGNPNQIDQVVDYWTFERDLKSELHIR